MSDPAGNADPEVPDGQTLTGDPSVVDVPVADDTIDVAPVATDEPAVRVLGRGVRVLPLAIAVVALFAGGALFMWAIRWGARVQSSPGRRPTATRSGRSGTRTTRSTSGTRGATSTGTRSSRGRSAG